MAKVCHIHGVEMLCLVLLFLLDCVVLGAAHEAQPKMLHNAPGMALGPPATEIHLTSNSTIYLGDCSVAEAFQFSLYGPAGRGVIGVELPADSKGIKIHLLNIEDGTMGIVGEAEPNFFALESLITTGDDYEGIPFEYNIDATADRSDDGGVLVEVTCTSATPLIIIVNDYVDLEIDALVTEFFDSDVLELQNNVEAVTPLEGRTRPGKGREDGSPIEFGIPSKKEIEIRHKQNRQDAGVALVDGIFTDMRGTKVRRTIVRENRAKPEGFGKLRNINVKCCDINEEDDIEIRFPGLAKPGEKFRVDVRLGIDFHGQDTKLKHRDVVDVTAILTHNGVMTVHGGWIRNALDGMGVGDHDFDVAVVDVVVSDPESSFRVVGRMGKDVLHNSIPKKHKSRRSKLNRAPSAKEEKGSLEMRWGRARRHEIEGDKEENVRRKLNSSHKKILVHGYCANGNPFPTSHFTDAIAFDAGANRDNNWSHDTFARLIGQFADDHGITGCACIAHSQGGAACLHLYSYYWSCLDYADRGGSKLIQTVGTPYQGSPLQGTIAAIGSIFGIACGLQNDLSTSGATTWLSSIPSWARARVTYYTTSFKDFRWWRDYCHLASDLILRDPDDGAVEKDRGQLSGGINGGHKEGQCHSQGMRDTDIVQTEDFSRNSAMNSAAYY